MIPKILGAQRDFSFGEIDVSLKRADDHPARKAGLRQMQNWRILNSGAIQDRPGRSALFPAGTAKRIEEITMSPGNTFKLAFAAGRITVYNASGAQVATFTIQGGGAALPWTAANLPLIVYARLGLSIYLTFPGMRPQILSWDGVATWTLIDYAELVLSGQRRTAFYRISPKGIGIQPSAQTGDITIGANAPLFTPGWVGTRIRFIGRQILITGYTNNQLVSGNVQEPLPGSQVIAFGVNPATIFSVGDEVIGSVTGSKGVITGVNPALTSITVQLLSSNTASAVSTFSIIGGWQQVVEAFTVDDTVVGPSGAAAATSVGAITDPTHPVDIWDQEVMNALQGYPASCFADQFRLGFCNFPSVPGGISWSSINSPNDLYVGANPSDAIFEVAPDAVQVYYVVPGPESSEFVFCDRKVYYIPINETNPLKPGSVAFKILNGDGSARVQPRPAQEAILYVNAGKNTIMSVLATGAYLRPFNTRSLTDFHAHLFKDVVCIACPSADGTFNERYAYVLNGDGSIAVGKYTADTLTTNAPVIGWGPWSGAGAVQWISAWSADVLFTASYFGTTICEVLDDTVYLDANLFVNALPAAFSPPAGKGPLWWLPSQTVSLMDQGTRSMGTYQVDANGFIIPQQNGGEDLTRADLVAGQPWTSIAEPFIADASTGQSVHQRMFKRRVSRFAAYVAQSTGFLMARLFSGPLTPTSPALGAVMNERRFPAYNQGDDPTKPPPLRETAERTRPLGRAFDPRVAVIKDTPGPFQLLELGEEATI